MRKFQIGALQEMRARFVMRTLFLSQAWLWLLFLIFASLFFSLGLACAVPLAAFAALGALTLPRGAAFGLIGAVWLTNQIAGYTLLSYPLDGRTAAWGFALATAGVLATIAALSVKARFRKSGIRAAGLAFLAAFAAYEGFLFGITLAFKSDLSAYEPTVIGRILAINAAAFAMFFLLHRFASAFGSSVETAVEIPSRRPQWPSTI